MVLESNGIDCRPQSSEPSLSPCSGAVFFCPFLFYKYVRTRHHLLDAETLDEKEMNRIRQNLGIVTLAIFNPIFLAAMIIGFWLAYHRVAEAIYG